MTDGMELPNQGKTRMLGEKETNKYLWILDADTTKQEKIKENLRKSIPRELVSYLRHNYLENK